MYLLCFWGSTVLGVWLLAKSDFATSTSNFCHNYLLASSLKDLRRTNITYVVDWMVNDSCKFWISLSSEASYFMYAAFNFLDLKCRLRCMDSYVY